METVVSEGGKGKAEFRVPMKTTYTGEATVKGGLSGHASSSEGNLDVNLVVPKEQETSDEAGTNPAPDFAVGSASSRLVPIKITRVMVAVDGSDHSKKAAELAIHMAKLWNAPLYFIHVQEEGKIPSWFAEFAEDEHLGTGDYFDVVDERLFAPLIARATESEIEVFRVIRAKGDPADEILRNAEQRKVDLIVMGNRGLGKFSGVILGSISTKVLSNAECTCITVK
jgi:nucleotide-binding universal stress UspA family protein